MTPAEYWTERHAWALRCAVWDAAFDALTMLTTEQRREPVIDAHIAALLAEEETLTAEGQRLVATAKRLAIATGEVG